VEFRLVFFHRLATGAVWLLLSGAAASAQDLDPRAYSKVRVGITLAITGFSFSSGGVLTDPTLPAENVQADVSTLSFGVAHSSAYSAARPRRWRCSPTHGPT
jgi:hypothetical protein